MNEDYYYIIDHKNSFNPINEDHQTKLRLKMLISCTSIDSSSMGNEINKFFAKIIPNNNSDLMVILSSLSNKISKDKHYLESNNVYDYASWLIDATFCNEDIFEFSMMNISIVGAVLVNLFLNEMHLYKIKSYAKLTDKINCFIEAKTDMVCNYNLHRNDPINNKPEEKPKNKSGNKNLFELFKEKMIQSKSIDIPIELAFLIQKMRTIKKIIIPLEALDDYLFNLVLMILLNYNILFSHCDEIHFDLSNIKAANELYRKYHKELIKTSTVHIKHFNPTINDDAIKSRWSFDTNHIENLEQFYYSTMRKDKLSSFDSSYDTSLTTTCDTIIQSNDEKNKGLFIEYKRLFELCIIYPYFISQWKTVSSFQLIFPTSYNKEVIEVMQANYKVLLMNYSLFDFFQPINQLSTLTAEFNSLDSETFEKLMSLIVSNSKLTSLTLSLFVNDLYYQPSALFKLMNQLKINTKSILQQNIISRTNSLGNDDIDQLFISHLMTNFEENIEGLFWVLKDNISIRGLSLFLVTPTLISNHERYSTILIKFVFNILLLLNVNKTQFGTFKLMVPYLLLDNRQFPGIYELFEHLDYEKNNQHLATLSLQIQFYSISNVSNLLTTRLTEVNIGDLDMESFIAFVDKIDRKEFRAKSCLRSVNIALLGRVTQFSLIEKSLIRYISIDIKPLESIMLSSFLHLTIDELNRVYDSIDYNKVKRYEFIFGKGCESIQHKVPVLKHIDTKITNAHNKIFKSISDKMNKSKNVSLSPSPSISMLHARLMSFILPIREKELVISYK